MKKISILLVLVILALVLLPSCGDKNTLKLSGDGVRNLEDNTRYSFAPSNYEAAGWKTEVYGTDDIGNEYHIVCDAEGTPADTSHYLYDSSTRVLLYNREKVTLPTLAEMNPTSLVIMIENDTRIPLTTDNVVENIQKVVDICTNAPTLEYSKINEAEFDSYVLLFSSPDHLYLVYKLAYYEFMSDKLDSETVSSLDGYTYRPNLQYTTEQNADGSYTVTYNYGKYFLFDRDTGLCYKAEFVHECYNN